MRFIDVDVLRDYWHISELCERCHWNNIDCSKPPYYSLLDICKAIDEIPTVDAIPVDWLEEQRDKLSEAWDEEWHEINGLIEQWREEQEGK